MCRSVPGECNNLMVAEIYPPSSVAFGVKLLAVFFPLEGEGYGT